MDKLFDTWANRNPEWEIKYEGLITQFCDYGRGASQYGAVRGKYFGAGYEMFIIAFFIGLYFNQEKPLTKDTSKKKPFGQPIKYWGNVESRGLRSSYPKIRRYLYAALIARTDIDFIALDKGEMEVKKAVDKMMDKMEAYANWGFDYMMEKVEENPNYFIPDGAFLKTFIQFFNNTTEDDDPESLD
ncbi:MAG: glycoside hydrolase family 15 [Bacteroidales bacterium]|nr:glycoside hydrolase family 15 [Candidatus Cacconaster equi]